MGVAFFRVLPSGLVDLLRSELPEFASLPERHQANIAQMLWDYASARFRHRLKYGAGFSVTYMRDLWGNLRTRNRVVRKFFRVLQGDNISHQLSAYTPYDAVGKVLVKFLQDTLPIELLNDGKRLSVPRRSVLSRAAKDDPNLTYAKNSVWQRATPSGWLPINEQALVHFAKVTSDQDHRLSALRLLRLSRNTRLPGSVPLLYEQKSTGRLTEVLFSVQSTEREVLSAALDGFWDYDLQNAHFGIFSQWAQQLGHETPVVDEYQSNKSQIRKKLAAYCSVEVDAVKESLIALMYGASLSSNPDYASIPRILGEKAAALFISHPFVKSLKTEIGRIGRVIIEATKLSNGAYVNAMGIRASKNAQRTSFTLLCHALQGVEAQVLQAVVRRYGDQIILCMHDGWVARERLDCTEIEVLIEKVTGFRLRVEERQLPKYPPIRGRKKQWSFGGSSITRDNGIVLSESPQWSQPSFVYARRTRADIIAKKLFNRSD